MEDKNINPVFDPGTIGFVAVGVEFCALVEAGGEMEAAAFVEKATALLPLLYWRASLLPAVDGEEEMLELCITEQMYESVRSRVAAALGERDTYLETFHPDMPFSDAPVAAFISEDLADVYQDVGNLCALFRQGNEAVMLEALALCRVNFRNYWGQKLLNALKALHAVRYDADDF
jgi:hypothetical protein